jgi:hypothetical protein
LDHFRAAWDARSGRGRTDDGGAGAADKLVKLQWCIYEAIRSADEAFLKDAIVLWLGRDERHGRLLVRFRAGRMCLGKLELRCGILGQLKKFGTGADNIAKATYTIAKRAVAPGEGLPLACGGPGLSVTWLPRVVLCGCAAQASPRKSQVLPLARRGSRGFSRPSPASVRCCLLRAVTREGRGREGP